METTPVIDAFWAEFVAATGTRGAYCVVEFGDSTEMKNELVDLVLAGTKRATASLARDYGEKEPLPKVGDHVVVIDGSDTPRLIWRTTEIVVKPLIEADEQFAWDEGEGDRTLEWWLDAHRRYFSRQSEREGFEMHDGIDTVFERFAVVWPADVAD